jgi:LmbE family N-acetylglucosaminyl deacetylase
MQHNLRETDEKNEISDLSFLTHSTAVPVRTMIVSPHPDDEVIGAGSRLPLLSNTVVVQVTYGSPPNISDARAAGCSSAEDYADLRRRELSTALALAGLRETVELGFPDQRVSFKMPELAASLEDLIREHAPEFIFTVPYEGGHPDHDATALAVSLAVRNLRTWERPRIVEMLSYHHCNGACEMERFLDENAHSVLEIDLCPEEREFKRRLFECFASQRRVLCWFPIRIEKFRFAPDYDFSKPPHPGTLYYEKFPWGMQGAQWRDLAQTALAANSRAGALAFS